jgi:hypothetical protein
VLDHDYGAAGVDQVVELGDQELDVGGVEAGGRLVQEVEGVAAAGAFGARWRA